MSKSLNRDKLLKIIARLASPHDGEILAAVNIINKMLNEADLKWPELLSQTQNGASSQEIRDLQAQVSYWKRMYDSARRGSGPRYDYEKGGYGSYNQRRSQQNKRSRYQGYYERAYEEQRNEQHNERNTYIEIDVDHIVTQTARAYLLTCMCSDNLRRDIWFPAAHTYVSVYITEAGKETPCIKVTSWIFHEKNRELSAKYGITLRRK